MANSEQTPRYRAADQPEDTSGSTREDCVICAMLLAGMPRAAAERAFDAALAAGQLVEVKR